MITVATDEDTYTIDADLSISLENLQALLEADTSIPTAQQALYCNGRLLADAHQSLAQMGVGADDLLLLRNKAQLAGPSATAGAGSSRGGDAYRWVRQSVRVEEETALH